MLRALVLTLLAATFTSSALGQSFSDLGASSALLTETSTAVFGKRAVVTTEGDALGEEYTGVLLRGYSEDAGVTGEVRFYDEGAWTAWEPLRFTFSATDPSFVAGFRDEGAVRSGRFEVRFDVERGPEFAIAGAGVFDNRQDVDAQPAAQDFTPHDLPLLSGASTIPTPTLIRRSEWGAKPFRGTPSPLARPNYLYLTFHHAAGYSASGPTQGKEQMQRIQDLHQETRGWSDVGYQFLVDKGGNLYQGRPFLDESQNLSDVPRLAMGAHVGGANTGNIGLSILGCYHPPEGLACEDEITPQALDAVVGMFAWLAQQYGLDGSDIRGHRDFSDTACPGDNNYALLGEIAARVDEALRDGLVVNERPTVVTLDGAFPNPFTESTVVRYYLAEEPFNVRLAVYDALGREVAVLVDEKAPGGSRWYNAPLDAAGLSSGTYYVRLTADDFSGKAADQVVSLVRVR